MTFSPFTKTMIVISTSILLAILIATAIANSGLQAFSEDVLETICPTGTFQCGNLSECLEQRLNCNGVENCPNGEDEKNCDDHHGSLDTLITNLQKNSSKIIKASLNHSCELSNFPPNCICMNETVLFCMNAEICEFPGDIIGNITRLILKNNCISWLPERIFRNYTYLTMVHLESNRIDKIEPFAFDGLKSLKKLFLTKNRLKSLLPGSFIGLNNATWIRLQYNELEDFDLNVFAHTPKLDYLDLANNSLTLTNASFPKLSNLIWLDLRQNKIENITSALFFNLTTLNVLVLSGNKIKYVHRRAFYNQTKLTELDLSNNLIEYLNEETFFRPKILTKLVLGGNHLRIIQYELFKNLNHLKSLDLENINIKNISIQMFSHMKELEFIYFKKFHYCSYVPHARVCKPNTDGVSSMEHLLVNPFLRTSVWVVATLTCIGNAMVLLGRFFAPEDNKVLSIFIRNLSAADFLMGIYLLVIGAHDYEFREQYNWYANMWMSSWKCTISGVLAMTSSETSVLIMCFMSVERFICIVSPFGGNRLTPRNAVFSMAAIWVAGLLLALVPILHWRQSNEFYGSNGMCFPLHIDDPFILGWEYSAFLFLGINFLSVIIIIIVYLAMFVSIHKTRRATTLMVRDKEFAFRFFFIVFTDCLCWIPIIILKLIAIVKISVTADLYAWVVVFILPINSAINPFLYTFTTSSFRTRAKKFASMFLIIVSTSLARKDLNAETISSVHNYSYKEESSKNGSCNQCQGSTYPIPTYICTAFNEDGVNFHKMEDNLIGYSSEKNSISTIFESNL